MRPVFQPWSVLCLAATLLTAGLATCPGQPAAPTTVPSAKPAVDGKVWGALIFGTNDAADLTGAQTKPPAGMEDLMARLAKVFPYPHFEILGEHKQDIFREYESWVVPSPELFLKVDSKGPAAGGGMNLHLQFWREQQVLVKTDAVLRQHSPLFIGGPKWRNGQLIFVLVLTQSQNQNESTPDKSR